MEYVDGIKLGGVQMNQIKIRTKEGKKLRANVERLDAVILVPIEKKDFYILRTGPIEYRQLSRDESSRLIKFFSRVNKRPAELSILDVEKAIAEPPKGKGEKE